MKYFHLYRRKVTHSISLKYREIFWGSLLSILFLPSFSLFADRIYLKDGTVLRGYVTRILGGYYFFKETDGTAQLVNKEDASKVSFGRELNYEKFFYRLLFGLGLGGYGLTVDYMEGERENLNSRIFPLRGGLEVGYLVIDNTLALHGGVEYSYSVSTIGSKEGSKDASYSYSSLNAGLSYYLSSANFYLSLRARMPQSGSFSLESKYTSDTEFPLKAEGLGYDLSLTREWQSKNGRDAWGLSLTYTLDRFKSQKKMLSASPRGLISPSLVSSDEKLAFIGLTFNVTYD